MSVLNSIGWKMTLKPSFPCQIVGDQHRGFLARAVADVGVEHKFNLIAVGVVQVTVAIAVFNPDFLQQLERLGQIVRIVSGCSG